MTSNRGNVNHKLYFVVLWCVTFSVLSELPMTIKIAFNTLIFIFFSQRAELETEEKTSRSRLFVSEKESSLIGLCSIQIDISTFPG